MKQHHAFQRPLTRNGLVIELMYYLYVKYKNIAQNIAQDCHENSSNRNVLYWKASYCDRSQACLVACSAVTSTYSFGKKSSCQHLLVPGCLALKIESVILFFVNGMECVKRASH